MNNKKRSMPMLVIDVCSTSDDHKECIKLSRSFSLLNYNEAYKDLSGIIHYSSLNHSKNIFFRSYSCPNNYFSINKSSRTTINLLDPNNGTYSPGGGSSSRYSLYESFLDLSDNGYHSSLIKTENKRHSLLIIENSSKLSMNTYQDKCNDWLNHLNLT